MAICAGKKDFLIMKKVEDSFCDSTGSKPRTVGCYDLRKLRILDSKSLIKLDENAFKYIPNRCLWKKRNFEISNFDLNQTYRLKSVENKFRQEL